MFGVVADRIKKFLFSNFNELSLQTREFFNKPKALLTLSLVSLAILDPLVQGTKNLIRKKLSTTINKSNDPLLLKLDPNNLTDDAIEEYFKKNRNLQRIMNFVSNELNEEIVADLVLACEDPNFFEKEFKDLEARLTVTNIDGNDFIDIAQQESDFDEKVSSYRIGNSLLNLMNKVSGVFPWAIMTFIILQKIREFLTQNEFPSRWRGKYLQKLVRTTAALIKHSIEAEKEASKSIPENLKEIGQSTGGTIVNEGRELLKFLSRIDTLITASLMATFIYLNNRDKHNKSSFEAASTYLSQYTCEEIEKPLSNEELSILRPIKVEDVNMLDFSRFPCPVETDNIVSPNVPFEVKSETFVCDIDELEAEAAQLDEKTEVDIATKAIFVNESKKEFRALVEKDDEVTTRTILATVGERKIYSPVLGVVKKIDLQNEEIIVDEILDPERTFLEDLINETQEKYKNHNDLKFFIKDFYIKSLYVPMLQESPLIDASISAQERAVLVYLSGGIQKRWEAAEKKEKRAKESYENSIKKATGKDRVKQLAENEEIDKIKEDVERIEKIYYNSLKSTAKTALNQSRVTLPFDKEFSLLEFYIDLMTDVMSYFDKNDIVTYFRDELNSIIVERFFIEKWNLEKLVDRINSFCNDLAEGTFFASEPNFFKEMYRIFIESEKKISYVENWVASLANSNKDFTEQEKEEITKKVMYMFEIVLIIIQKIEEEYKTKSNRFDATNREATFIRGFFDELWKEYDDIPEELENIYQTLEDMGESYIPFSIQSIDNEQYRYYAVGEKRVCPEPKEEHPSLSPFTQYEMSNIKYWIKYCSIATLVGVSNFPLGWATGFPPPIGPILFPVAYVPIRAFQLAWGTIVLGISITGIYPFPFVLFVNQDTSFHVPFFDPASFIKKEVSGLKKALSFKLKDYKQNVLKGYLDKTEDRITVLSDTIVKYTKIKREHKLKKPKRNREIKASIDIPRYTRELAGWIEQQAVYTEIINTTKIKKWQTEQKYDIVKRAYDDVEPIEDTKDPTLQSFQKSEEALEKQFTTLDKTVESINKLLAPLPISTKPMSANFGFTVKNPKPIINFGSDIDSNINYAALKTVQKPFGLSNSDFMSSKFGNKLQNSSINFSAYKKAIAAALPLIIIKDPFPKYENLKLTNLAWITFLYTSWTRTGAQTYGFPGFPQYPI